MEDITFLQFITLTLLGLLFFKEEIIPWIKDKLGLKVPERNATQGQVDQLAEYVNHRQTEILDAQTRILGETKAGVEKIISKQEEWDRHVIPVITKHQ